MEIGDLLESVNEYPDYDIAEVDNDVIEIKSKTNDVNIRSNNTHIKMRD